LIRVEIQKDGKEKIIEFTYDPFGRRLSKSVHREKIDEDDDGIDNDNDDDDKVGNRLSKTDTDTNTYYIYDNEDIIMEYNPKGKVAARYIHGQGIDEPLAIERKAKTHYYHADGLGSITALTDVKGKVVQRYDYDSFGNMKHHGHKVKQLYTYTAREYDRETGLHYYRARYYDPKTGRFIRKDPFPGFANLPQTLNRYTYVGNNPANKIDPWGLLECQLYELPNIDKEKLPDWLRKIYEKGKEYEKFDIPGLEKIPGTLEPEVNLPGIDPKNLLSNPENELEKILNESTIKLKYKLKF
jgi:RHS repeat-associated protein